MRIGRPANANRTNVLVITADAELEASSRATFAASNQIQLNVINGRLNELGDTLDLAATNVVIVDIDAGREEEMAALARLMERVGGQPPVITVTQNFDESVARTLLQMRVADFLVKPVETANLVRACSRATSHDANDTTQSHIYTFLPAVGGGGVTTLAVQTAMLLLNSEGPRTRPSTCLVDLDFQSGCVADYLDLEPRLNFAEIEPRPERLDRQLLEVMLSYHPSGLAVLAAPNRPADIRTFDTEVVTRLLDLVSSNFRYVVFDMPRAWCAWTDSVLLGSNELFIVSETTVPSLRHAKQLVAAITDRLGDGINPKVIVNRFDQRWFGSGLRRKDLEKTLGESLVACIPNDYALVREAIDRGVPLEEVKAGNKITVQIKKLILDRATTRSTVVKRGPQMTKLRLANAK